MERTAAQIHDNMNLGVESGFQRRSRGRPGLLRKVGELLAELVLSDIDHGGRLTDGSDNGCASLVMALPSTLQHELGRHPRPELRARSAVLKLVL